MEIDFGAVAGCVAVQCTLGAEGKLAVEAFLDEVGETFAERLKLDLLQHFVAECIEEKSAGGAVAHAAGTDVEEGLLVELSYGAAV